MTALRGNTVWWGVAVSADTFSEKVEDFYGDVKDKLHRLDSISERLELIPLAEDIRVALDKAPASRSLSKIFVVHGHHEGTRDSVARFLERLGLQPIILHEQVSGGMTIIEKLEKYSDVGYAVVLLTTDDEGRKKANGEPLRDRARQNVILELGYFTGKLGRNRVCALHRGNIENTHRLFGRRVYTLQRGGRVAVTRREGNESSRL